MVRDSRNVEITRRQHLSKITNGSSIGVDKRTKTGRRYRDLISEFSKEVAGNEPLSEAEKILVRQAASLTIRMEVLQLEIVNGTASGTADEDIVRLSNSLCRILGQIVEVHRPKANRPGRPLSKDQKHSIAEHFASRKKAKG